MMAIKAIVSLSGGVDSATLLAKALDEKREVLAVTFLYGSKHNGWEAFAAARLIERYNVLRLVVNLADAFRHTESALMAGPEPIPEGYYQAESMRRTVVPGRNMIFASVLAGIAMSRGYDEVWMGMHAGDHYIYPDCRHPFVSAMDQAVQRGTDDKVRLRAPFLYADKKDIVMVGLGLKVPYHLTRTCYTSDAVACGKCGACVERREAFALNGVDDPIEYEGGR